MNNTTHFPSTVMTTSGKLSTTVIALIGFVAVLALIGVIVAIYFLRKRLKENKQRKNNEAKKNNAIDPNAEKTGKSKCGVSKKSTNPYLYPSIGLMKVADYVEQKTAIPEKRVTKCINDGEYIILGPKPKIAPGTKSVCSPSTTQPEAPVELSKNQSPLSKESTEPLADTHRSINPHFGRSVALHNYSKRTKKSTKKSMKTKTGTKKTVKDSKKPILPDIVESQYVERP